MLHAIIVSVLPIVLVATFPGRVDHSKIADLPGANLSEESIVRLRNSSTGCFFRTPGKLIDGLENDSSKLVIV